MNIKVFITSLIFTVVFRLIKIFPNNDPIMGFILPQTRSSALKPAIFAFSAMFIFDFFTSGIGIWTIVTATVYAGLAILFSFFFKKIKKAKISQYLTASVIGVLIFDIITGPLVSYFFYGQALWLVTLAQVPFTFYHLISATTYVIILAPIFDLDIRLQYVNYKNKFISQFILMFNFLRFLK